MPWLARTELLAIDRSDEMIAAIWPGDISGNRKAVCANWLAFPETAGEYDAVLGDGVFALFSFPAGFRELAAQAHRALNHEGILIVRLFVRPPQTETVETVLDDLRSGAIGNFHVFKFRLAMALQPDSRSGVRMQDVFAAWEATRLAPDDLATSLGWSRNAINTIEQYRNKSARLSFPTLEEFTSAVSDYFSVAESCVPTYEMGDRCPLLCFRRRATFGS